MTRRQNLQEDRILNWGLCSITMSDTSCQFRGNGGREGLCLWTWPDDEVEVSCWWEEDPCWVGRAWPLNIYRHIPCPSVSETDGPGSQNGTKERAKWTSPGPELDQSTESVWSVKPPPPWKTLIVSEFDQFGLISLVAWLNYFILIRVSSGLNSWPEVEATTTHALWASQFGS